MCYTNHALDDILTGLLDIGIPEQSMLRLGGKFTPRTEPLTLRNQTRGLYKRSQTEWKIIDELKVQLATLHRGVEASFYGKQDDYAPKAFAKQIRKHMPRFI